MSKRKDKSYDIAMFRDISDDFCFELNRTIKHYLKHECSPLRDYDSGFAEAATASVHYLAKHVFSKYNDTRAKGSAVERRTAAIVKWLGVEQRNARTNLRLISENPTIQFGRRKVDRDRNVVSHPPTSSAWDLLFRARGIVGRILGPDVPENELASFLLSDGGFTSGASTSKRRSLDTLARKFTERMDATPSLLTLIHRSDIVTEFSGWDEIISGIQDPRLVKGNILFTVPKNAEIDRVACKEPDLNLFCQKSVGNHIRRRLRLFGINLNDQTRNQSLAKHAYTRGYSTIDLSSASDSLSTELVRQLVSPGWFRILMALRSPKTFIDGASHVNAMISSMGNGFTFELESMIFYALARAVQGEYDDLQLDCTPADTVVGVFGDDLIVNQRYAHPLIAFLGFCGFKVNASKSFIEGSWFESCGKHYYCGQDVSPFYVREQFSDISDLIHTLNQLRSWMQRVGIDLYETVNDVRYSFYEIWLKFSKLVPRSLHGGWDLEVRTSLVTLGLSRCKLVPVMIERKRVTSDYLKGMYLARLADCIPEDTAVTTALFHIFNEHGFTAEFPSSWNGRWKIQRYTDTARFFGIATNPLYQEMESSYGSSRIKRQ